MTDDKLAQDEASMFERNIAHLARRGKEVEIWLRGVPDSRVGLIAGLDGQYIQTRRNVTGIVCGCLLLIAFI